jgi:plasmid stabilization system protein ParE
MSYSVNWTSEAEETFDQNIGYLEKEWNSSVLNQFLDRVDEVIQKIKIDPFLYTLHQYSGTVRKCVINKRIIMFYRILDDKNDRPRNILEYIPEPGSVKTVAW